MALTATIIYAISVCAIFGALLLLHLKRLFQNQIVFFLLKKIVYPFLYRRFLFLAPITRLRALALLAYATATVVFNRIGVHTEAQASIRAGWLSVINLIPLFISGRVAMVANALGLSLRAVFAIHTATGSVVVAQTMTHIFLELRNLSFRLDSPVQFYGFLVALLVGIVITRRQATLDGQLTYIRPQ